jgi:hypothetical protein
MDYHEATVGPRTQFHAIVRDTEAHVTRRVGRSEKVTRDGSVPSTISREKRESSLIG